MENTLFNDGKGLIHVTNRRLVVQGKTYPLRQLTSVEFREDRGEMQQIEKNAWSRPLQIVLHILALIIFLFINWIAGITMFVLTLGVAWAFPYTKPGIEGMCHVMIETAAGTTSVFSSKDRKLVRDIVEALNNALITGEA